MATMQRAKKKSATSVMDSYRPQLDWGGGEGGQSTIAAKSKRGVEFHSLICFVTGFPRQCSWQKLGADWENRQSCTQQLLGAGMKHSPSSWILLLLKV